MMREFGVQHSHHSQPPNLGISWFGWCCSGDRHHLYQVCREAIAFWFGQVLVMVIVWLIGFSDAAGAASLATGQHVFQANCTFCHVGGQNLIIPAKNLQLDTLHANQMDSIAAITHQVTYGKNIMPAFGTALSEEEIESVATYVMMRAKIGWDRTLSDKNISGQRQ